MAGLPMTRVGDAGEEGGALSQHAGEAFPGRLDKTPSQEYASLRRMALVDVEPGQHSRHAVLKGRVRPAPGPTPRMHSPQAEVRSRPARLGDSHVLLCSSQIAAPPTLPA